MRVPATLVRAARQVSGLAEQVTGDPLAIPVAVAAESVAQLRDAVAGLDAATACARDAEQRLAALREAIEAAAAAVAAAAAEQTRARSRVLPGPAAVPADDLGAELDAVRSDADRARAAASGDWAATDRRLAALETRARALQRTAEAAAETERGLVDERDALRGRLTAFQAKAVAVGLAEDPDLETAHRRALDELYSAPCDLARAADLVEDYRRGLSRPRSTA